MISMILRKSQVTLFMILGLILVIIVVALLFVLQSLDFEQTSSTTGKDLFTQKAALDACVRQHAMDAIELLGVQGGVIYADQGGPFNPDPQRYVVLQGIGGDGADVFHRVYKGVVPHPSLDPPPAYPSENQDIFVLQQLYGLGIWGSRNLPRLCDSTLQSTQGCPPRGIGFGPTTVQRQIQTHIRSNLHTCQDREGNAYDWSGVLVDVRMNLDDLRIFLSNVSFLDQPDTAVVLNIRLKRAYTILSRIVDDDVASVLFDKRYDVYGIAGCNFQEGNSCFIDGFDYSVVRDVLDGVDILVLSDNASIVNGKPFVFMTAIDNRPPALNLRYQIVPAIPPRFRPYAELYAPLGSDFQINPSVYDADEDTLRVVYRGWGQDTMTSFNEALCCVRGVCALADPACYTAVSSFERFNQSSAYFSHPECGSFICANKTILPSMRGYHQLRIEVYDGHQGSYDYQDFRLVVGTENDIITNLSVLEQITASEEDECLFFSDMLYNILLRNRGTPAPVDHASPGCQVTMRPVLPPQPNEWGIAVDSRAQWLETCNFPVDNTNIDAAIALNRFAGRADTMIPGTTVKACFFRSSNHVSDLQNFYTLTGPFDDEYSYGALGFVVPPLHPSLDLSCTSHSASQITDADIWSRMFTATVPGAVTGTQCKYLSGSVGCACWKCQGQSCDFFVSYQ